jgi:sporulation protein YlmC with PRC-barrel domain
MNHRRLLSASTLRGDAVRNAQGEDLGKVEDLMIDVNTGNIGYVVLSFGGIFGIGDKLFAVPWSALSVNEDEHRFILNVPRERLEKAPGFDKNAWPDFADPSFRSGIDRYYTTGL